MTEMEFASTEAYCKLCRTGHEPAECQRRARARAGECETCGVKRPAMVALESDHGEWHLCSRCYRAAVAS